MKWFTHIGFSILIFTILIKLLEINDISTAILGVLITIAGGLFPDMDINFKFLSKHRGIFHSLFGLFTFSLGALVILRLLNLTTLALFFFLGYFFHLLIDSFNPSGITWFPLTKKSKGTITTGGLTEKVLAIIIWGMAILLALV